MPYIAINLATDDMVQKALRTFGEAIVYAPFRMPVSATDLTNEINDGAETKGLVFVIDQDPRIAPPQAQRILRDSIIYWVQPDGTVNLTRPVWGQEHLPGMMRDVLRTQN
ncbi:hypothetical protein J4453_01645 [Candidatus Woesearchaeota archaeon]|nr:hypothetical protein [Candidatus Woesearchaeota archaeon]